MSRLSAAPGEAVASLAELVGIAASIEHESARRYAWLAAEMRRRGETETAAVFERLRAEEQRHIAAVDALAEELGEPVLSPELFQWRLPADLAESWEEAARQSALTPYRAYAIAVDNEERAFAFFAYLAATAANPRIAAEAERLAQEELRHAAHVRVWRRTAWRRERQQTTTQEAPSIESVTELKALIAQQEAKIAACHDALRQQLADAGESALSEVLRETASEARALAGGQTAWQDADGAEEDAVALLALAQKPLTRYCELLEDILVAPADEAIQTLALASMERVVARQARIGRQIEQRSET